MINKLKYNFVALILLALLGACDNQWDKHYNQESGEQVEVSSDNLFEYLSSQPNYSKFVALLEETGVAEELSKNQVLTVWVVSDENFEDIGKLPQGPELRKAFALHHVNNLALYSPKLEDGKLVKTLAGKNAYLTKTDENTFALDGHELVKPNQLCANGVVHEISGMLEYKENIYDAIIESGEEYSLFREHFLSFSDTLFREDLSFPIGVTPTGQTIYDSVFVINNKYLYGIRDFRDENQKYTLFLPNNEVYTEAFNTISEFYGNMLSTSDSLFFKNWILEASVHFGELRSYESGQAYTSCYDADWRTDYQEIDPTTHEYSNGIRYNMTKLHIPRNLFVQEYLVNHNKMYKELSSAQQKEYYRFVAIKQVKTDQFNGCMWADYNKAGSDWETAYKILHKDRDAGYKPVKVPPGKYKLEMSFRPYHLGKHDVYVNGKLVKEAYNFGEGPYETSNYKLRHIVDFTIPESEGLSEIDIRIVLNEMGSQSTGPRYIFFETKVSPLGDPIY